MGVLCINRQTLTSHEYLFWSPCKPQWCEVWVFKLLQSAFSIVSPSFTDMGNSPVNNNVGP